MAPELWLALSPVLGLALNGTVFVLTHRTRPAFGLLRAQYLGFLAGAAAVALLFSLVPSPVRVQRADAFGHAFLSLASYAALGYCHFHFVNLGETARRIRLLWELREAGGTLTRDEILARYSAGEIIEKRLSRLLGSGQIVLRDNRLFGGGPTVAAMATCMVWLKMLLLGRKHEHDT